MTAEHTGATLELTCFPAFSDIMIGHLVTLYVKNDNNDNKNDNDIFSHISYLDYVGFTLQYLLNFC